MHKSIHETESKENISRLLALPPELRDLIFEYALTSSRPIVTFRLDTYQRDSFEEATQPALTRVNRQLRLETLSVFYACNAFVLHTEGAKLDDAREWLCCNEAYLKTMRHFEIWIRHITRRSANPASHGAVGLSVRRSLKHARWRVSSDWRWITVIRKPSGLQEDAEWLIARLRRLLINESTTFLNAEAWSDLIAEARVAYLRQKAAYQ